MLSARFGLLKLQQLNVNRKRARYHLSSINETKIKTNLLTFFAAGMYGQFEYSLRNYLQSAIKF
jgi:hypothetical protein